jgi:hypothetical protein
MNRQTDIGKRVEKALESLDGIQKAEPQPYFFTRLKARLERDNKSVWEMIGSFLARPAIAIVGLCLILALNVFILIQKETATTTSQPYADNMPAQEDENIFATATNAYDYENLEP